MMKQQSARWYLILTFGLLVGMPGAIVTSASPASAATTYTNPLPITSAAGLVESCPDPAIIRGQQAGDTDWYLYCTTDPYNGTDRRGGAFNYHLISMFRSHDLIHWRDAGDAFAKRPGWVRGDAYLWAPEVQFWGGRYHLYYTATETNLAGGGSAIGVATSANPTGPWADSGAPVVEPQSLPDDPKVRRWTFDPVVVVDATGQRYLMYGSYIGGVAARRLSADGLHTDPASQTRITAANRYEGAQVVRHGGAYYLFVSATDCCHGPLTGYGVFAGRATSPLGPYIDRDGMPLLDGRVGGTPVLAMNGDRWAGPGHGAVFTDFAGQDWMLYHAIARDDPYFTDAPGFTKRPALLDPIDWIDGWPVVRGGQGASDTPQAAPTAQPGLSGGYTTAKAPVESLGLLVDAFSDDFTTPSLRPQWSWVRPPAVNTYGPTDGTLRFATQAADLFVDTNTASVLTERAPNGDYTVETRVRLDLPPTGCCYDSTQAGLVIYGDDDNYLKLVHVAMGETRQTEFAKEESPVPPHYPRYGNSVIGAPGEWTYLRIVKRTHDREEWYTAYTSGNGAQWTRGGTWTHHLGRTARIGLVAMGGAGFTANFDYVRVYTIAEPFVNHRLGSG